jgi:hypothetical protein
VKKRRTVFFEDAVAGATDASQPGKVMGNAWKFMDIL